MKKKFKRKSKRRKKYVGIHPHVFERAVERKLCKTIKKLRNNIISSVKISGIMIPQIEENKFLCVFRHEGKYITCSVIETEKAFMVITMWESSEWERNKYVEKKRKLLQEEG